MLKNMPPERDEYGQWMHPQLEELFGDRELIPADEYKAWLQSHGIEACSAELELDECENDRLQQTYFEDGEPDLSLWEPAPPGPEWAMLALVDTEDGAIVTWYRHKPSSRE
ncbi:MAG TPA: hypothetical protein VFN01_00645 [Marinobacter sp.]|uniref:hypothetical protein n=1 Tax=Marinobacter sp. TaxID=50741 RepID=UPI002D80EB32|nr:hypothetical protein [Marinobacter sp.]HET8799666.1 hypothetical protein [Marinobacter sp.]